MRTDTKSYNINQLVLYTSFALATIYWATCESNSHWRLIGKVGSTTLLTYYRHLTKDPNDSHALTLSLACHSAGDLLIDLSEDTFLLSMIAFFAGHSLNAKHQKASALTLNQIAPKTAASLITLAAYVLWFNNLLIKNTSGVIQKAIPAYCMILFTVLTLSALQKQKPAQSFFFSFLYAMSDKVIAINQFVTKLPGASYFTWPCYFIGQVGSVLHSEKTDITLSSNSNTSKVSPNCIM